MSIERVNDLPLFTDDMFDDDDAFVTVPAFRLGIHHPPMPDAVDGLAKIGTRSNCPPIFTSVIFVISIPKLPEITTTPTDTNAIWWGDGEVEDIDEAAGCAAFCLG